MDRINPYQLLHSNNIPAEKNLLKWVQKTLSANAKIEMTKLNIMKIYLGKHSVFQKMIQLNL